MSHFTGMGMNWYANIRDNLILILMDIQMKFMDGMSAAEEIREKDSRVVIIFITNMTQYAVRGYEVDAMDYILKPVKYFTFSQKLQKALNRIRQRREAFLTVAVKGGMYKIPVEDLFYIGKPWTYSELPYAEGSDLCQGKYL